MDWHLGYPKDKDSVHLCGLSVIILLGTPASIVGAKASVAGDSMVDLLKKSTDRRQSEHIDFTQYSILFFNKEESVCRHQGACASLK